MKPNAILLLPLPLIGCCHLKSAELGGLIDVLLAADLAAAEATQTMKESAQVFAKARNGFDTRASKVPSPLPVCLPPVKRKFSEGPGVSKVGIFGVGHKMPSDYEPFP
ncbi:hypothetical protein GPALN_005591 [Globodera pallida]|nr:hypothetical protein GPALN_005591 [Globodera pallida]